MKVKATERGFYECLREVGETFDIPKDMSLGSWMEKVKPGRKAKKEPEPVEEGESEKTEGEQ